MGDQTLTLHRVLKAPRTLVWDCLTKAEHLAKFYVPAPNFIVTARVDPRPGGAFYQLLDVGGQHFANDQSILALEPNRQLVVTDLMIEDFQPAANPMFGFTAEFLLEDHPDGTDYTIHCRHRTAESAAKHAEMGFEEGWGTVAAQMERYIQTELHQ